MDNEDYFGTFDAFDTTTDDTTADYTTDLWDDNVGDNSEDVGTEDNLYYLSDGTQVPIDELEQGYLRQSDYTRKTQDLASQRAQLAEAEELMLALQADPKATLEALQRHLIGDDDVELDDLDPLEKEVRDHRQFIEQQRSLELQHEVENELAGLEQEYGEFDWDEVLEFAISREIPDLEAALLLYDSELEREAARIEANGQILAQKRGAPPVARGSRAQGQVSETFQIGSVMDAWEAAKRELGYE